MVLLRWGVGAVGAGSVVRGMAFLKFVKVCQFMVEKPSHALFPPREKSLPLAISPTHREGFRGVKQKLREGVEGTRMREWKALVGGARECWGNARHRPEHASTRLPSKEPPEAPAEDFCRRRQRYEDASVMERPPQSYGQRSNSPK
jgi:hypothetical protein